MREMLFRGQTRKFGEKVRMNGDKVPGNWVYGGICQGKGDFSLIYGYGRGTQSSGETFVVYSDTVGQYTGLTDRTQWGELTEDERKFWLGRHTAAEWVGKPIFEGDIVEGTAYSSLWRGVIVWIDEIAGFGVRYRKRSDPTAWENASILKRLQVCKDEFAAKVIGNIYDNPELLDICNNT